MPLRLILDTNVWLDWLVFKDPGIAPLRSAVASGRAEVFINATCALELARVLASRLGKHALDTAAQAACLAECGRIARRHAGARSSKGGDEGGRMRDENIPLPVCRDPDDQKFLELARACRADFLVTRDLALLELARRKANPAPFRIVTLEQIGRVLRGR